MDCKSEAASHYAGCACNEAHWQDQVARLTRERDEARERAAGLSRELLGAMQARDSYRMSAERRVGMRREVEEILGCGDTMGDNAFGRGLARLRELVEAESRAARLEAALALICDASERNADVCICEMKRIAPRHARGGGGVSDNMQHPDEKTMRETKAPRPETVAELAEYITGLTDRPHDYGTCVYAMSLAATAAFNHVAHRLGVTGFQASCADLDVLRRTRSIEGPFILLRGEDMLYPRYDLPEKLRMAMAEWSAWAGGEARKKLAESKRENVHPNVWTHWERLALTARGRGGEVSEILTREHLEWLLDSPHDGDNTQRVLTHDAALRAEVERLRTAATLALAVLTRLADSAAYWSDYDVPVGLIAEVDEAKARLAGALNG